MTPAAFKGTYSDFKLIKTRGVVSISFEVPVEQAQAALDVLGGMPVTSTEVWCAVARLQNNGGPETPGRLTPVNNEVGLSNHGGNHEPVGLKTNAPPRQKEAAGGAKQAFRDMRMVNQAGMLCEEASFQRFLAEKFNTDVRSSEQAAMVIRGHCNVKSRSDIRPRCFSGNLWTRLVDEYRTWMHMPEPV